MISFAFALRNSQYSFSMQLPNKIFKRASDFDDEELCGLQELPKFSFEDDTRPLVSTERLFHQWSGEGETTSHFRFNATSSHMKQEEDIIVGT